MNTSHLENTLQLLKSDDLGMQGLGFMLATDPHAYPSENEKLMTLAYPQALISALLETRFANPRAPESYAYMRRAIQQASRHMQCNDPLADFVEPLERDVMLSLFTNTVAWVKVLKI